MPSSRRVRFLSAFSSAAVLIACDFGGGSGGLGGGGNAEPDSLGLAIPGLAFGTTEAELSVDGKGFRLALGVDDTNSGFILKLFLTHDAMPRQEESRSWSSLSVGSKAVFRFDSLDIQAKVTNYDSSLDFHAEPKGARILNLEPYRYGFASTGLYDRKAGTVFELIYVDRACRLTVRKDRCGTATFAAEIPGPGVYAVARNLDSTRSRERIFRPSDDVTRFLLYNQFVMENLIKAREACHDPEAAKPDMLGTWWSVTPDSGNLDRLTYRPDDTLILDYEDSLGFRRQTRHAFSVGPYSTAVNPSHGQGSSVDNFLHARLTEGRDTLRIFSQAYIRRPDREVSDWILPLEVEDMAGLPGNLEGLAVSPPYFWHLQGTYFYKIDSQGTLLGNSPMGWSNRAPTRSGFQFENDSLFWTVIDKDLVRFNARRWKSDSVFWQGRSLDFDRKWLIGLEGRKAWVASEQGAIFGFSLDGFGEDVDTLPPLGALAFRTAIGGGRIYFPGGEYLHVRALREGRIQGTYRLPFHGSFAVMAVHGEDVYAVVDLDRYTHGNPYRLMRIRPKGQAVFPER